MWTRIVPLMLIACLTAQTKAGDWEALQYLLGDWIGEGSGEPGQGSGSFSFTAELDGKILVRRNRAEYPKTKDRAAYSHEDLMILYRQPPEEQVRAVYFDNEQHAIRYTVQVSEDRSRFVFTSDEEKSAPRFRFTYERVDADRLKLKFEIAPHGKPDQFSTYVEGTARRRKQR